jgi:hypothetical protein
MESLNIKIVGMGGIGCCLFPCLARYLQFQSGRNARITLIDGDAYEERNQERQSFRSIGNKAEVKAKELASEFPGSSFFGISQYLNDKNAIEFIREGDVVFSCVDSKFVLTRKYISDRAIELNNVLIISGGNELTTGNVRFHWRKNRRNLTLPLANKYHPEVANPVGTDEPQPGCGVRVKSEPQIVLMNNLVAAIMLAGFYAFLQGKLNYDEVYMDMLTGNVRIVQRKR